MQGTEALPGVLRLFINFSEVSTMKETGIFSKRESEFFAALSTLLRVAHERKDEWRLDMEDLNEIQALFDEWAPMYTACQNMAQRTPVLVQRKNELKKQVKAKARVFVQCLQKNPRMTDDGRRELGIRIYKRRSSHTASAQQDAHDCTQNSASQNVI
jgi:hypothetical protein